MELTPEQRQLFVRMGREGNEARQRVEGVCVQCAAAFYGYPYKRYCSTRCRTRATRARQAQEGAKE